MYRQIVFRGLSLILCLLLLVGMVSATVWADEEILFTGDVDANGKISVRDALAALKIAAGLEDPDEKTRTLADVDGDGIVNAKDAVLILKKAAGLLHYFPAEKIEASGHIYIAGDSIASEHDYDETYERQLVGWGVVLKDYFTDEVTVYNEARSGRSSSSYLTSSNYNQYIGNLAKGDYYLISFGHNDEKLSDPSRYTDPYASSDTRNSFKWYLKTYYIDPAIRAGAFPVLLSSVVRCTFADENTLSAQSHEAYAIAMEELVEEYKEEGIIVGYIDMQQLTADYYNSVGREEAETLHAYTASGLDTTHYCEKGAKLVSQMIIEEMERQGYDICKFLKTE